MKHNKCKIVSLALMGAVFIMLGVLLGKNLILKVITKTIMEQKCVDSIHHKAYSTFLGNASKRPDNFQIKIYHWNLTNEEDFLYNGALPQFKEVGPYVYIFGNQKLNVEFTVTTVKYQGIFQSEYSPTLTREQCPTCNETDKFTTINFGYLGLIQNVGSDLNLALSLLPPVLESLLVSADYGTNRSTTLRKIGKHGQYVLPDNSLPSNFKIDFSAYLFNEASVNSTLIDYKEKDMSALYNVLTNSTLLGVTGVPPPANCSVDPSTAQCLQMGFLVLANWMNEKSAALIGAGENPNTDASFLALFGAVQKLLCPDKTSRCLSVTTNPNMIQYIAGYVTYLVKIVMELMVDSKNYGLLTKRTHNELATGFVMDDLKFPGFPGGIPVQGFVPNDGDIAKAKLDTKFTEVYKCGISSKREFTWAKYNNSEYTPEAYFPDGDESFRQISTKYTSQYFGTKENLAVCVTHQEARQESFVVYDNILKSTYTIRLKGPATFSSIPVHDYETDLEKLYAVNNVSVYKQGLIDASAIQEGLPVLYSAPHFLKADEGIVNKLRMKPELTKHNSYTMIEPITGNPLELVNRLQLNTLIRPSHITAPRLRPYNITFAEANPKTLTNPFPVVWNEMHVFATQSDLQELEKLFDALKGSCTAIIIGPLVGTICLLLAAYFYWKQAKRRSSVDTSEALLRSLDVRHPTDRMIRH